MKLTGAAIAGRVLLWIGFIGGALASVFRLENSQSPWQTIPWSWYLASTAVGIVGVVLLRREKALERLRGASSETGMDSVVDNLQRAADKVADLAQHIEEKTCEQVLEFIDEQCAQLMADFSDGRMVISNRFGTATYAAVMTEFASGERYLNRAWSAAADGYIDEVTDSIKHASGFLAAANRVLKTNLALR